MKIKIHRKDGTYFYIDGWRDDALIAAAKKVEEERKKLVEALRKAFGVIGK